MLSSDLESGLILFHLELLVKTNFTVGKFRLYFHYFAFLHIFFECGLPLFDMQLAIRIVSYSGTNYS